MAFGRAAPGQLVADAIEAMIGDLVDAVVGSFGVWLGAAEQLEDLGVHRVREPARLPPSRVPTQVPQGDDGVRQVAFRCQQLECLACARPFAPAAELLGLRPHQRPTGRLSELAASTRVEVGYAKAPRLLAGPAVSARTSPAT